MNSPPLFFLDIKTHYQLLISLVHNSIEIEIKDNKIIESYDTNNFIVSQYKEIFTIQYFSNLFYFQNCTITDIHKLLISILKSNRFEIQKINQFKFLIHFLPLVVELSIINYNDCDVLFSLPIKKKSLINKRLNILNHLISQSDEMQIMKNLLLKRRENIIINNIKNRKIIVKFKYPNFEYEIEQSEFFNREFLVVIEIDNNGIVDENDLRLKIYMEEKYFHDYEILQAEKEEKLIKIPIKFKLDESVKGYFDYSMEFNAIINIYTYQCDFSKFTCKIKKLFPLTWSNNNSKGENVNVSDENIFNIFSSSKCYEH